MEVVMNMMCMWKPRHTIRCMWGFVLGLDFPPILNENTVSQANCSKKKKKISTASFHFDTHWSTDQLIVMEWIFITSYYIDLNFDLSTRCMYISEKVLLYIVRDSSGKVRRIHIKLSGFAIWRNNKLNAFEKVEIQ